jgi:Uma2 family endonuclease
MTQRATRFMTALEFLEWEPEVDEKFELIAGVPRMMTGASRRHDRIVVNVLGELRAGLRGSRCSVFTADLAVVTRPHQVRRPDVGVECFDREPDGARAAENIRLVVEVLSPSTRAFDLVAKVEEYKALAGLDAILLLDPDRPQASLWTRQEGTWSFRVQAGLDEKVEITSLGLSLDLREAYDGLSFPEPPEEDDRGPP